MGCNYLSITKLQRCNRWSLGIDKLFHPTLYWACDYLSMSGLKLNHVSKRGPRGMFLKIVLYFDNLIWYSLSWMRAPFVTFVDYLTEICTIKFLEMEMTKVMGNRSVPFIQWNSEVSNKLLRSCQRKSTTLLHISPRKCLKSRHTTKIFDMEMTNGQ